MKPSAANALPANSNNGRYLRKHIHNYRGEQESVNGERREPDAMRQPGRSQVLQRFQGCLHRQINQALRDMGLAPQANEALARTYNKRSTEWQAFTAALSDIKRISDDRNLPTPVFVPLLFGTGDYNHPSENISYIIKWCRQAEEARRFSRHLGNRPAPIRSNRFDRPGDADRETGGP